MAKSAVRNGGKRSINSPTVDDLLDRTKSLDRATNKALHMVLEVSTGKSGEELAKNCRSIWGVERNTRRIYETTGGEIVRPQINAKACWE